METEWDKERAVQWLQEHSRVKDFLDGLEKDGVLKKMDAWWPGGTLEFLNVIPIAKAAGYETGLDHPADSKN